MRKSIKRLTIPAIAAVSLSTSAFAAPEQAAKPTAVVAPRDAASGIVSPRDPASGQASGIVSPRDPASGQASGIVSPRDAASGQATSRTSQPGPGQPRQGKGVTFEDVLVSSAVAPKPGATTATQTAGFKAPDGDESAGMRRKQGGGAVVPAPGTAAANAAPQGTANARTGFVGTPTDGQGIRRTPPARRPANRPRRGGA